MFLRLYTLLVFISYNINIHVCNSLLFDYNTSIDFCQNISYYYTVSEIVFSQSKVGK